MGGFFLVLLLVVAVCSGIPLVLFAYAQGWLVIPKRLLTIIIFCGIVIVAIIEFPLKISIEKPASFVGILIIYTFAGSLLSYENTKSKWRFCMLFVFLSNCLGVFIKCLIVYFVMEKNGTKFTLIDIGQFLLIIQIITSLAFYCSGKRSKKAISGQEKEK